MILFDSLINEFNELIKNKELKSLLFSDNILEDAMKNNMVFSSDKAYELGGDNQKSLSFELCTSNNELINEDKILLIGKDLYELNKDTDFFRITILNIDDNKMGSSKLYDTLETIKFTKYRVSPKGYMLRTSINNKEKIRLSKETAKESFSRIGSAYIKAYKLIPCVKNVRILFVTENSDLYNSLFEIAKRKDDITDTLDHILKGMVLNDCGSCTVKELCDEVEGLRQFHEDSKNG